MNKKFWLALSLAFIGLVGGEPAVAACTSGSTTGFSSGGAISGNQVVVCATSGSSTASTKSTTSKAPSAKAPAVKQVASVAKPVCPTVTVTTAQIVAAALLGCPILGPSSPPPAAPIAKPTVSNKTSTAVSIASDQAAFTPAALNIVLSQSVINVGESVLIRSDAQTHERTASILGRTAMVKFDPVTFDWSAPDSFSSSSDIAVASFSTVGNKPISLSVGYQASYRFALADAWLSVGRVYVNASDSLVVKQAAAAVVAPMPGHLVWANCTVHPSNYRC